MELFTFGFNTQSRFAAKSHNVTTPISIIEAEVVEELWASWCDAVIASKDTAGAWTVGYSGTGLTAAQQDHLGLSESIANAVGKRDSSVTFFGGAMHDGLRGYVVSSHADSATMNQIIMFATDLELEEGLPEVQFYPVNGLRKITDIKVTSGGGLLLSAVRRSNHEEQILYIPSLSDLRTHLASNTSFDSITYPCLAPFIPAQWEVNATTSTILDHDGKAYTSTQDPRYSKCLGRPFEGASEFEPVPYLSETHVTKVASGGYMSAAVSSDGELFLWGQACPGSKGELEVLNEKDNGSEVELKKTRLWVEGEQDEFVKCLTAHIDGEEAEVYDVAVGHGHLMVAAKVSEGRGRWAVFAAGDNSKGQLGLDTKREFVRRFEEVVSLRGKRIKQLVAIGWSSFGVVDA